VGPRLGLIFAALFSWALILLPLWLLMGCAPAVEYRDRVTRVEVPVSVPCLDAVPPAVLYPYEALPAGATTGQAVRAARLGLQLHRRVESDLRALLQGCAALPHGGDSAPSGTAGPDRGS
jgi:hypothetical protein